MMSRVLDASANAALRLLGVLLAFGSRHTGSFSLGRLAWLPLREANQRDIRGRCMVVRTAPDTAVCRVLGRFKMYVEAGDYGHAVHLMFDGYWEMYVTQVIASHVRRGMTVVDVGANQGYYTLLMAALVGEEGRVHAVEPNPRMTALLSQSVAANGVSGRVEIHALPLGATTSRRVVLRVPDGMPSGAYLEPAADDADAMVTATLDAILGDGRVDLIKIDAEGSEMAIWQGAQRILARRAPLTVVMEFILDRAPDAAAFLAEVASHGFTLSYVHHRDGLRPVTAGQILAAPGNHEWLLVLRRGRQDAAPGAAAVR